jgi:hypothetical protein
MSKTIEDLRAALFATIEGVRAGTTSVDQAKTIGELSQVTVNSAKIEIDYLRVTEGGGSSFISTAVDRSNLQAGITGIVQHRIKG